MTADPLEGRVSDARLVVLVGPTAVGKTAMALEVASRFDAEIVGADSVQIYRLLDVGSAKPTPAERQAVPHHLIDVLWPDEACSAAQFAALADEAVAQVHARGRRVLVVGGTGLYLRALLDGLFAMSSADTAAARQVRTRLLDEEETSPGVLYRRLTEVDPEAAALISPADVQRLSRALEVFEATGTTISELRGSQPPGPRYDHLIIGLDRPRDELYARIDQRGRAMLAGGIFGEVHSLLRRGYDPDLPALKSLGYRHCLDLLRGRLGRAEMERLFLRDTRRYAKRQLTWFRKNDNIWWGHPDDPAAVIRRVGTFWTT
jgi:tRNA dimethylallyltransferase